MYCMTNSQSNLQGSGYTGENITLLDFIKPCWGTFSDRHQFFVLISVESDDHVCLDQTDRHKRMIIITKLFFFISHADYHLIDICTFIT